MTAADTCPRRPLRPPLCRTRLRLLHPRATPDRAPIDLTQLPPWPCCGHRGHHSPSCPSHPKLCTDRHDEVEETADA